MVALRRVARGIVLATFAVGAVGCGCGKSMFTSVDGVMLAEADQVVPAPAGPRLVLAPTSETVPALPVGAKVVQLAVQRQVPWRTVRAAIAKVRAAGVQPVVLVGDGKGNLAALPPTVDAVPESILVEAELEGKACLSPPRAAERQCGQQPGGKHIDRAFVRGVTREAIKAYALTHVHVRADASLEWADVVRTLDGVRTCCAADVQVKVSLEDAAL